MVEKSSEKKECKNYGIIGEFDGEMNLDRFDSHIKKFLDASESQSENLEIREPIQKTQTPKLKGSMFKNMEVEV